MKSVLMQLSVYMLLFSAVRLAMLDREEVRQYQESKTLNALSPPDGSLDGIDAKGNKKVPELSADGHLKGNGYLLAFVIHRQDIVNEIQFWNRVIDLTNKSRPGSSVPIQYWGICAGGSSCEPYQSIAHFNILGYLDPYEMHTIAKTDADHRALLYDHSMMFKMSLPRAADPSSQSNLIVQQVK